MTNNKKQRGREEKKKRIEVQQEAKKAVQRRRLQELFGTPAIDDVITEIGRSASTTVAVAASKPANSASSAEKKKENDTCYHGSSAAHFVAGSVFLKTVKSFVSLNKKCDEMHQLYDVENKFMNDEGNQQILLDGEFTNFVFAVAVTLYLKSSSEERERYHTLTMEQQKCTAMYELKNVIRMGLQIKYSVVPCLDNTQSQKERFKNREKAMKYIRDINTERGRIKCLHRETKQYCDCMATNYNDIKDMSKMERCYRCRQEFLKKLMKKCDGCEMVVYCSKTCCSND